MHRSNGRPLTSARSRPARTSTRPPSSSRTWSPTPTAWCGIEFTMPEALTQWRFLGFAHDQQLRSGFLTDKTVTAKDLMVQPNPPRFLREGDVIEFTVKVTNQSATRQTGKVRLTLADARDAWSRATRPWATVAAEQTFDVPAKESRTFSWRLTDPGRLRVPDLQGGRRHRRGSATARRAICRC